MKSTIEELEGLQNDIEKSAKNMADVLMEDNMSVLNELLDLSKKLPKDLTTDDMSTLTALHGLIVDDSVLTTTQLNTKNKALTRNWAKINDNGEFIVLWENMKEN